MYSVWEIFDTAWGVRDDTAGVDGTAGDGSPSSPVPHQSLLALEDGEVDPDLPDLTLNDDDDTDEEYVPTTQPEQTADADENDEYDGLAPKNLDPYLNDVSGDASESAICPTQPSPMEFQFESDSEPGMSQSIGEKHVGHDIPMTREEFELTCETQPTEEHYPMETLIGHNESDAAQPTPPATGTEAPSIGTKDVDMMPPPPPMPDKVQRRAAIEQRMAELRLGVTKPKFKRFLKNTNPNFTITSFLLFPFHTITPFCNQTSNDRKTMDENKLARGKSSASLQCPLDQAQK